MVVWCWWAMLWWNGLMVVQQLVMRGLCPVLDVKTSSTQQRFASLPPSRGTPVHVQAPFSRCTPITQTSSAARCNAFDCALIILDTLFPPACTPFNPSHTHSTAASSEFGSPQTVSPPPPTPVPHVWQPPLAPD